MAETSSSNPTRTGLELRVHGVHGTSPASMLGVAPGAVRQVAGDSLTGIFRAHPEADLPSRRPPEGLAVEAYSWGALTSGVQGALGWLKRVLWLLLVPFALSNLAYWARLEVGRHTARARWGVRAVRLSGLLLTVLMILTPCVVSIDMLGWQCFRGLSNGCPSLPGQLGFLAGYAPTRRLAATSVLPLLVLLVLYLLSRTTLIRYEAITGPLGLEALEAEVDPDETVLAYPKMWRGKTRGTRLQRLHLTVGLATVVAFSAIHLLHARSAGGSGPYWMVGVLLAVATLLALGAFVLACVIDEDDVEATGPGWSARRRRAPGTLAAAMGACTLLYLAALSIPSYSGVRENIDFYGHNVWFIGVFVALTAAHLSLFVGERMRAPFALGVVAVVLVLGALGMLLHARQGFETRTLVWGGVLVAAFFSALVVWHYRTTRWRAAAWRGAGASVVLATAAWVGLLFTSAAVTGVANYLNGSAHSVSDLASSLPASEQQLLGYRPLAGTGAPDRTLTVSGDITVRGAVIVLSGAVPTVISGTVAADELSRPSSGSAADQGIRDLLGSTRVTEARVTLPEARVAIVDSCVRTSARTGCTAESPDFVIAGTVPAAERRLAVLAAHGHVTIKVANPPQIPIIVPQVLIWTPIMQLAWVLLSGLAVGICLLVFAVRARGRIRGFALTVGEPDGDVLPIPPRDRSPAAGARTRAAFAHRAERLLDVVGAVTSPVALALILLSSTGEAPWQLWSWSRHFATLSLYAVLALSAGMVLLGSRLRRSESTRKTVGVIWDLTTFWPRAAHPLAPPCYAERVVPELLTRLHWALGRPDDPNHEDIVVLSGHSQGSAIVVATAARLSQETLRRIRIITYGSQVRALYGRVFPRVLGPDPIGYDATTGPARLRDAWPDVPTTPGATNPVPSRSGLRARLGDDRHWVNLFRRTDPLGWRVFSDDDSADDVPVMEVPVAAAGDPGPRLMTHSGYQHTPEYRRIVGGWLGERYVDLPEGTTKVPPLPEP